MIAVVPLITFFSWTALPIMVAVVVFLLMLILVPYSIYTIYMAPLNISYDASFVFITNRKTEKIITLKSIKHIQPVSGYGSLRQRWQISYLENGLEEDLFFYPKDKADLVQFIKVVRMQNPMVAAPEF